MREYEWPLASPSLSYTKWDCKYHVMFIPKKRKKVIFGGIRKYLGKMLHELAVQKGCQIVDSVSNVVGYIKGKSPIGIARHFLGKSRNFSGENFWARGYFVSTVGLDEAMVRAYIREQEKEDERYEQLKLGV